MQTPTPRPPETRSWEPAEVKIDPITASRPTNADLGRGVNQLHECLEGLKGDHNRRFGRVERDIRELKEALVPGGNRKTLATQSQRAAWWRTFAATGGAIAAAGVVLRTSEVVWPWVRGAAMAIYHAMLAGRI